MTNITSAFKVRSVLLAGSPYNAYLLEEAGFKRSGTETNAQGPEFNLVRSGADTLKFCEKNQPNLIIADYNLPDMTAFELGQKLSETEHKTPLMVITSRSDLGGISANSPGREYTKGLFIWYGDTEILRTLVRLYEDEMNIDALIATNKALSILLIEDEPNFYSHYLPTLYSQIRKSTMEIMSKKKPNNCPWSNIRSRPLVLLRQNYESACEIIDKYPLQIIAIITDMQFPKHGELNNRSGMDILYHTREYEAHIPIVVQSRQLETRSIVEANGGSFLWKDSPHLLGDLSEFLLNFCGFGPFTFRWPDGNEWARASSFDSFIALISNSPLSVFEHHGSHNDFSAWLGVHGYGELAALVRQIRATGLDGKAKLLDLLNSEYQKGKE